MKCHGCRETEVINKENILTEMTDGRRKTKAENEKISLKCEYASAFVRSF